KYCSAHCPVRCTSNQSAAVGSSSSSSSSDIPGCNSGKVANSSSSSSVLSALEFDSVDALSVRLASSSRHLSTSVGWAQFEKAASNSSKVSSSSDSEPDCRPGREPSERSGSS